MRKVGITVEFVQDNMSLVHRRVRFVVCTGKIRLMHEVKLVSCTKGTVIDVAVDIRKGKSYIWSMGQCWMVKKIIDSSLFLRDLRMDS